MCRRSSVSSVAFPLAGDEGEPARRVDEQAVGVTQPGSGDAADDAIRARVDHGELVPRLDGDEDAASSRRRTARCPASPPSGIVAIRRPRASSTVSTPPPRRRRRRAARPGRRRARRGSCPAGARARSLPLRESIVRTWCASVADAKTRPSCGTAITPWTPGAGIVFTILPACAGRTARSSTRVHVRDVEAVRRSGRGSCSRSARSGRRAGPARRLQRQPGRGGAGRDRRGCERRQRGTANEIWNSQRHRKPDESYTEMKPRFRRPSSLEGERPISQ